jgi:GNAT superfamily N-acetyltransferase
MPSLWRAIGEAGVLLFRAAPSFEARLAPGAAMGLSGEPYADFNYLVISGGSDPAARLGEFVQAAQARKLPFTAIFADEVQEELAATATSLGMRRVGSMPLMIFRPRVGESASTAFQVASVETEHDLRTALGMVSGAFGSSPDIACRVLTPATLEFSEIECFMARREGMPVSTVWTTRRGGMVTIWNMATPAEHQRQGAGYALLSQVIAGHLERGVRLFSLLATEAGFPLYRRIGFQTVANPVVGVMEHTMQIGE